MSVERTREAVTRYLESHHTDLSIMAEGVIFDATAETRSRIFAEHQAVLEADFVGTHIGTFDGFPATGRSVRVPLCVVYDLEEGKIKRGRVYLEVPVLLRQLGAAPAQLEDNKGEEMRYRGEPTR